MARASVSSGGTPGSWLKLHNGSFSQPGRGGECSAIAGVAGTAVYHRASCRDFIAVGQRGPWLYGSLGVSTSSDGVSDWQPAPQVSVDTGCMPRCCVIFIASMR
jgi:hypothetical protein